MTDLQQIENQTPDELACLLVPMSGCHLLVPTVSVAEMVPFRQLDASTEGPEWYMGEVTWRDMKVPLLSFEQMNGDAPAEQASGARVAVLNNTGQNTEVPFIGIFTQGVPKLARVLDREVEQLSDRPTKPYELMRVLWSGDEAVIPDIAAIEMAYIGQCR